jgi:hypothetical protein
VAQSPRTGLLVEPAFVIPAAPRGDGFRLSPLQVAHNERDLDAWSSSVAHIHDTPGFGGHRWPDEPMTLERNRADLERHAEDFAARRGFTYTVLCEPEDEVIGCVYIYPSTVLGVDARVRSWVRMSRAELDAPLWRTVRDWLRTDWPFTTVDYAARTED